MSTVVPEGEARAPARDPNPVLVELDRGGRVESWHRGRVLVLAPDGSTDIAVGDPERVILPRSTAKPAQAAAMVALGLDIPEPLLALAAASHSGEPRHLDGARDILGRAGLSEADLRCPPAWSMSPPSAHAPDQRGTGPLRISHNCSGKHAAMLATCVAEGWPTGDYLSPDHPLQQAILASLRRLASGPVHHVATDGCGAPVAELSMMSLARLGQAIAQSGPGAPEHAVYRAMTQYPEMTSGAGRPEARLMQAVPGLLAKVGAEGVFLAVLASGQCIVTKIDDGADRAAAVVVAHVLTLLGICDPAVRAVANPAVLGGGKRVGSLTCTLGRPS